MAINNLQPVIITEPQQHHFFLLFFLLASSLADTTLLTMVGLPKKDSSLGWVPLLAFSFFIAPSILLSANPFSPQRNFLSASQSMFFSHLSSQSSVTCGFLNSSLASSKAKSSSLGRMNLTLPSRSFSPLQYSSMFSMLWNYLMNLQAFTGPIPSILEAQSQPQSMHMSTNSCSVSARSCSTFSLVISVSGYFLLFTSLTMICAPNTKQSVSSVQTASIFPFLLMQLHCASAQPGACTTGMPISRSMCMTSSRSFFVMQVVRCCCFRAQARLPIYSASSFFSVAYSFTLRLRSSSPFFLVGALPSKTQTGLIPFQMRRRVRLKRPSRCPVLLPSESVRLVRKLESEEMPWVETRNWYMDMEASSPRIMLEKYCISLFLIESGELARSRSISLWMPILTSYNNQLGMGWRQIE